MTQTSAKTPANRNTELSKPIRTALLTCPRVASGRVYRSPPGPRRFHRGKDSVCRITTPGTRSDRAAFLATTVRPESRNPGHRSSIYLSGAPMGKGGSHAADPRFGAALVLRSRPGRPRRHRSGQPPRVDDGRSGLGHPRPGEGVRADPPVSALRDHRRLRRRVLVRRAIRGPDRAHHYRGADHRVRHPSMLRAANPPRPDRHRP